ncbi:unnamed protein product [Bursaphelenchus xylophilus]|nr:unnamed protein product [Bursaphelenchus xylophilus]CAG9131370.1 unnamed protein product [Bursaphelenchus xylophilus]
MDPSWIPIEITEEQKRVLEAFKKQVKTTVAPNCYEGCSLVELEQLFAEDWGCSLRDVCRKCGMETIAQLLAMAHEVICVVVLQTGDVRIYPTTISADEAKIMEMIIISNENAIEKRARRERYDRIDRRKSLGRSNGDLPLTRSKSLAPRSMGLSAPNAIPVGEAFSSQRSNEVSSVTSSQNGIEKSVLRVMNMISEKAEPSNDRNETSHPTPKKVDVMGRLDSPAKNGVIHGDQIVQEESNVGNEKPEIAVEPLPTKKIDETQVRSEESTSDAGAANSEGLDASHSESPPVAEKAVEEASVNSNKSWNVSDLWSRLDTLTVQRRKSDGDAPETIIPKADLNERHLRILRRYRYLKQFIHILKSHKSLAIDVFKNDLQKYYGIQLNQAFFSENFGIDTPNVLYSLECIRPKLMICNWNHEVAQISLVPHAERLLEMDSELLADDFNPILERFRRTVDYDICEKSMANSTLPSCFFDSNFDVSRSSRSQPDASQGRKSPPLPSSLVG